MVTVTNTLERVKKDRSTFPVLEISGGAELFLSQTTQRNYATVRKCTIPFTGTMEVAKMLNGQKIEGEIVKLIVALYDFINQRTGEVMKLQHSYAYRPKDSQDLVGHTRVQELAMAQIELLNAQIINTCQTTAVDFHHHKEIFHKSLHKTVRQEDPCSYGRIPGDQCKSWSFF